MCGRYTLIQTNELAERFDIDDDEWQELRDELKPRYNVAPEQVMPVIKEENDEHHLELMQWGFMPPWAHEPRDIYKYNTFNARSEGVFAKPLWKRSAILRRCLVPASGFYEWRDTSSGKQPYFIQLRRQHLFAFTGIYRYWRGKNDEPIGTYAILATGANRTMSVIHDRMPVIVHRRNENIWLDTDASPEVLQALFTPFPDNQLVVYPVSRAVNTTHSDASTLVQPINSR